ncbi:LRR receptor-like serine/threonine-protein kinase GSO2 [Hordeum vulgare]|nr:LRR receptor-like serine/threonine-protein kinase GSO2 [Hordeum vulgare]
MGRSKAAVRKAPRSGDGEIEWPPMLHSSSGCFVEERSALLDIRSSLPRAHSLSALDSWGEDGDDCCSWERVKCNNTTQRVSHLNLISIFQTYSHDHWYLNLTVFSALHELEYLDLSNNNPCSLLAMEGLVGLSKLRFLDLSRTTEGGGFPDILGRIVSLEGLSLYGNYMTGGLSSAAFENFRNLRQLDMSWNSFSGDLPALLFTLPSLWFLDLSINSFSGQIPINSSSGPISLEVLNLGFNNLSGTLPVGALKNIRNLKLNNNLFKGSLPGSIFSLPRLKFLDLSHNNFEGHFRINLSPEPVPLQVLCHNNISGSLPACIGNISFKGNTDDQIFQSFDRIEAQSYSGSFHLRDFTFATKGNLYTYGRSFFISMSGIDLSTNMLDGEIPWELGNLSHIKSLNLSNNLFVGPIPTTFGGMEEIGSLDLSHNKLSGPIPWQLTQLSSLGAFSVAYNNLSGCIPNSGQLGSFSMDRYLANTNLHKITHGDTCAAPGPDPAVGKDMEEMPGDRVLYVATAAGFVLAFWATIGFSFCHPYIRSVMLKL